MEGRVVGIHQRKWKFHSFLPDRVSICWASGSNGVGNMRHETEPKSAQGNRDVEEDTGMIETTCIVAGWMAVVVEYIVLLTHQ